MRTVVCIAVFAAVLLVKDFCWPVRSDKQFSAAALDWLGALETFCKEQGATPAWESCLPERAGLLPSSTDLSRALIRSDGQPVLLVMELEDLTQHGNTYTAAFTETNNTKSLFSLCVKLDCSTEQAEKILKSTDRLHPRLRPTFAVAARITELSRPAFETSAGSSDETATADSTILPSGYLAKGVCVGVLPKPEAPGKWIGP